MAVIPIFVFENITKRSEIDIIRCNLVNYNLIRQNYKIKEETYQLLVDFGPKMAENG